jgi:RimJ/RimL family protein N-acetyltransferase
VVNLVLRAAAFEDARLLWKWRNEAGVRKSSFNSDVVPWKTHQGWLRRKLASPDCRFWILEVDGQPAGQVRYDRAGPTAEIALAIDHRQRGRNLGSQLLILSAERACRDLSVSVLVGLVKADNAPSVRAFTAAGFERVEHDDRDGQRIVLFQRRCSTAET